MTFDDIWLSDDEEYKPAATETYGLDDNGPVHVDLLSLKRKHAKQGYLDGISKAKEESLQQGFDEGYPIGARIGARVGEILAQMKSLLMSSKISAEEYDSAFHELNIKKVLQTDFFDTKLNMLDERNHPIIRKWMAFCESKLDLQSRF
ncbi:hypothetical protein KL918_002548 [Ogataea parapolymorpha]|uniref:Protein YAE1 n=1 Tax=Ogataea parapolymorpha (strain ATCC 26012 / BCRC 20466 / JCM 22074 / NRRL Y-7560 / DL-1) TaxID=871575 RepID=W1QJ10_OGAPD|nr:hypothetical protein HPODL_02010 [Ogataea parapolymorpha DL-1]ESX02683.1 hypothetical protein HPODL_02010 [Ogataea parapolymorpha DL-1]KAG7867951.1 hypothetical protein KL918_002548 [Ogataea parapolymorpha]KAG7870471.1 hypothetical protein KL916_004947 [Ogataea parapolymorpha]KAG7873663.1 hypothetical protein KL938_005073 [Ogataea parapolymorpha]